MDGKHVHHISNASKSLEQKLVSLTPTHESDNSFYSHSITLKYKWWLSHVASRHNQDWSKKYHNKLQKPSDPFDKVNVGAEVSLSFNSQKLFSQIPIVQISPSFESTSLKGDEIEEKFFHKPSIVIGKTQETSYIWSKQGSRPILNHLYFCKIKLNIFTE